MSKVLFQTKVFIILGIISAILSILVPLLNKGASCNCVGICPADVCYPYGSIIKLIIVIFFIIYAIVFLVHRLYSRVLFSSREIVGILATIGFFLLLIQIGNAQIIIYKVNSIFDDFQETIRGRQEEKKMRTNSCMITGCSGQVCSYKPEITTCEVRPEYGCYKAYSQCERQVDKLCGWTETPELRDCLERAKNNLPIDLNQLKNKTFNF